MIYIRICICICILVLLGIGSTIILYTPYDAHSSFSLLLFRLLYILDCI